VNGELVNCKENESYFRGPLGHSIVLLKRGEPCVKVRMSCDQYTYRISAFAITHKSQVIYRQVSILGRTARTFRNAVDIEEARWKPFRRTLRPIQRENLDLVFDYARTCADAGTMLATPRVTEVVLISTIIEMIQELQELREKVLELEAKKGHE